MWSESEWIVNGYLTLQQFFVAIILKNCMVRKSRKWANSCVSGFILPHQTNFCLVKKKSEMCSWKKKEVHNNNL